MVRIRGGQKRKPIYTGVGGFLARAVDGAIGLVNPRIAHEFRKARVRSNALIAYEAARITRVNPASRSSSADAEILPDLRTLRDLSRTMVRDDAHAATTLNILEETVVGEGVRPQSRCTPESTGLTKEACDAWRAACEAEWNRWAEDDKEADATEWGTFYDLQALALRAYLQDGDAIGHAVIDGDRVSCELIDADRIESPRLMDTDTIRGGVELGDRGQRVAFHVLPQHPDEFLFGKAPTLVPDRIPVRDGDFSLIQHVMKRVRPGQTRGVPLLTPGVLYSRHLHHYLDSELIAARAASNYALFIKRNVTATDQDLLPVQDSEEASGQEFHEVLEPGIIEYLNEGEEPVPYSPNRPGTAFDPFVTRVLRAVCASAGLSYEIVARDFGRMNLSSARALLRECRRGTDIMRRRLVRMFCQPWWENVIRMAVAAGRLRPPARWLDDPKPFLAAGWVAPGYGMVDPLTDVEASVAAVAANLSTPYVEAAQQGKDAEQILRDRARFLQRASEIEKEHGLPPGSLTSTGAPGGAANPGSGGPGGGDKPGAPASPDQVDPQDPQDPEDITP